jgi:glycerol-3-phosphate cytidylyltransferase-like family protein
MLCACAFAAAVLAPGGASSSARAESDADMKAMAALAQDIIAQQKTLTDNQAKVDEKLAAIAEQLRLARIFESRAGGTRKAP